MSFEFVRGDHGQPRVRCICDDCGREEVVAGDHARGEAAQAVPKVQRLGWSYINKKLRCGQCEAKRKVKKMAKSKSAPAVAVVDEPLRRPTMAQKREIMGLLQDVYDVEAGRYKGSDTDAAVADVLGVMPGWVAEIREEFYGPDGGNADIEGLAARLDSFLSAAAVEVEIALTSCKAEVEVAISNCRGRIAEAEAMRDELRRIREAVGAPVRAKARVR